MAGKAIKYQGQLSSKRLRMRDHLLLRIGSSCAGDACVFTFMYLPPCENAESVAIIGKRSNQIAAEMKEELLKKLNEFSSSTDNLEEQFENHEQIEISRYYERLPKPTLIAAQEFLDDKIYFRDPSKEIEEEEA